MTSDKRDKSSHRIPIKFTDADDMARDDAYNEGEEIDLSDESLNEEDLFSAGDVEPEGGGPDKAELVATRSELKRIETENAELKDLVAHISVDVVHPFLGRDGWTFATDAPGATGDRLLGKRLLREVYLASDPQATGRVTVPLPLIVTVKL